MAGTGATGVSRQRVVAGLALIVLAVAAIVFPVVFSSPVVTNYAIYALIFVAAVSAWNMFSGFSGYISLGQAVFFGSGAYAVGIAARDWHINGIGGVRPAAASRGGGGGDRGAVRPGGAAGAPAHVHRDHDRGVLHLPADRRQLLLHRRLRGRLGAVPAVVTDGRSTTASTTSRWPAPWPPSSSPRLVRRSRFGLQLRAIRDDEDRARGLGVRAMRVKLTRVRAVRRGHGAGRRGLVPLPHPGRAALGIRPAVRPVPGADGVPRRPRDHRRPGARRAHHRARPALPHRHVHQRVPQRDPARRAVPRSSCCSCRGASSRPAASGSSGCGPGAARRYLPRAKGPRCRLA